MQQESTPRFSALILFGVFLFFYLGLSIRAGYFYSVSMPVAFLIASASAMLMNRKAYTGKYLFKDRIDY